MKRHASMNRVYRLIWSQVLNTWVCCAENAKGHGKSISGRKLIAAALALMGGVFLTPLAMAGPVGGQVSAGAGTIAQTGVNTTITQSTQNLAINWQDFSIAANESVRFIQPSTMSVALNRVIGQNPSQILGSLSANGQVFVLNPNGVLFGSTAQVNVGGLVASTLNLSDADLMAGNYSFGTPSPASGRGTVVNQGHLTAAPGGYIALLAPEVRNEGVISATLGTALLAAGDKVTLNLNNGSLLSYSIDQGALQALADNKQLIQADGGRVFMSAKAADALSSAVVNNTGIIQARTIQNVGGVIKLMGDMQVGTVNVGGTLDASVLPSPAGGRGAGGAGGGFIETSAAHVKVANDAHITTAAPNGLAGTWLIDPSDFIIAATGGDLTGAALVANLATTSVTILSSAGTVNLAGAGDILVNDALSWNSANSLTLNAVNNISVNAAISNASTGGINLTAAAAVNVGANLSTAGAIAIAAPTGLTQTAGTITTGGGLTVDVGAASIASGIIAGAGGLTKLGVGTLTLTGANTFAGGLAINAGTVLGKTSASVFGTGAITLGDSVGSNAATLLVGSNLPIANAIVLGSTTGLLTIGNSSTAILPLFSGGITGANNLTINNSATTGSLLLSGLINNAGTITNTGTGTCTTTISGAVGSNVTGIVENSTTSALMVSGALTVNGGGTTLTNTSGTKVLTLSGGVTGTGNLILHNNSATTNAIVLTTTAVNHTGTLTNSGSGTGSSLVSAGIATNVTGVIQDSATSMLTLSGVNPYTGTTTINGGTLSAGAFSAFNPNSVVMLANTAGATLDLAGFNVSIASLSGGGATGGNVVLGTNGTLNLGGNNASTTFAGVISGAGGLTKSGTGTLTLTGTNTFTGATLIQAGTMKLGNASALGTIAAGTTVQSGATLDLNGQTVGAEALTLNNTGVGGRGALINSAATAASLSGTINLSGASSVSIAANNGDMTLSGNILGASTNLILDGTNAASTVSGIISMTGLVGKLGSGTWTLSGANTYSGATTILAGTMKLGNASALGTVAAGTTVQTGATLDLNGQSVGAEALTLNNTAVGGLGSLINSAATAASLSGTINLSGSVSIVANNGDMTLSGNILGASTNLTLDGTNAASTVSGIISTTGSVGKLGSGTWTLSGANTYSGTTAILAGTLKLGHSAALGASIPVSVYAGGTLDMNGTTLSAAPLLLLSGTGVGGIAGALTNSSTLAASYNGTIILGSASSIVANNGNITLSGTLNSAGFGLTLDGSNAASTLSSVMGSTSSTVTKKGAGTWVLAGANSYTGATTVNAGTLMLGNASALGSAVGGTFVAAGATLDLNGISAGVEPLMLNGGGVGGTVGALTNSAATAASFGGGIYLGSASSINASAGNITLSGAIDGAFGLDVLGGGTLTLGGLVGNTTPLASFTSAAGTTLNLNGGVVKTSGAQTYNGTTTFGVATTLAAGNLAVNGAFAAGANNLTLNSGGTVTETGTISTTGLLTVRSAGGMTLDKANAIGSLNAINTTSGDISLSNTAATLNITGINQTGAGVVSVNNQGGMTISGMVNSSGDLAMVSTAGYQQTGGLLNVGGSLGITSSTGISFGNVLVQGNLTAVARNGSMSQTAGTAVNVTGTSTLTADNGIVGVGNAKYGINLNNAGNDFGGIITAIGNGISINDLNTLNATIVDAGSTALTSVGNLTLRDYITGNLTTQTTGVGSSTLFGKSTIGGNLSSTSQGTITQNASGISVAGSTTLSGSAVNLASSVFNDFVGAVSATGTGIALLDGVGGLQLGNLNVGTLSAKGNLTALSRGGAITQAVGTSVNIWGASTLIADNNLAGTNNVKYGITLNNAANDFRGKVSAIGNGVSLTDVNALIVAVTDTGNTSLTTGGNLNVWSSTTGNLTTTQTAGYTQFGTSSIGGSLVATSPVSVTRVAGNIITVANSPTTTSNPNVTINGVVGALIP
ncbi:MAG: autotransporter-associated beta strand repeat-containing protein [Gallionella sp.]|nr:autotransporter-associated beta strand repeat-containing protein [Gallionella sp.]